MMVNVNYVIIVKGVYFMNNREKEIIEAVKSDIKNLQENCNKSEIVRFLDYTIILGKELNLLLDKINNPVIGKALLTTFHKLNYEGYKKVLCSISGGSDSDIVVDIITKCDNNKIVDYVFFDTGLEYQATKEHINFLENKYNINIEILRPKIPIPLSCKRYGQPFLSKRVSEMISRLQNHNCKMD